MTDGQKLYEANVASAKNPRQWKKWTMLASHIKAAWEAKAVKKVKHNPPPKPKSKPAKKKAAKKGGKK